jgi:hypothetical protein
VSPCGESEQIRMRKTPILLRDDSPLSTDCDDEEVSVIFEGYNLSGGNQKFENFATNDNDLTLITDSNKKRKLQEEMPKEIKSFSKRKLIIPSSTKSFFFDNLNKDEHVEYDDNSAKAILDSELGVYANRKSNMRIKLSEATSGAQIFIIFIIIYRIFIHLYSLLLI